MNSIAGSAAAPATTALSRAPRRRWSQKRKQTAAAYLLIMPFVVVFLAMLVVPLIYSGYLSFFRTELAAGRVFVGLGNYFQAMTDHLFIGAVLRMCLFLGIQVPIMLGFALFFALALDSGRVRGHKFVGWRSSSRMRFRGSSPRSCGATCTATISGRFTKSSARLGLPAPNLLSPHWIIPSMMNIVTWEFIGYNMIILYAAMRSVSAELYEAAELDGAGQFRIAWT